jgi:hypothetical protein
MRVVSVVLYKQKNLRRKNKNPKKFMFNLSHLNFDGKNQRKYFELEKIHLN